MANENITSQNTVTGEQTQTGTDSGQTPNPQTQTQSGSPKKTAISSLPADIQDYIKTLRKEAEGSNEQLATFNKEKQQEQERKMREEGQYKELLTQKESRIQELEQFAQRYEKLAGLIKDQVKTSTKGWPTEALTFHPGDEASAEDLLAWQEKATPYVARLAQQQQASQPGNSPNPRPSSGELSRDQQIERFKADRVKRGMYGL